VTTLCITRNWVASIAVGKDGNIYYPDHKVHTIMRVDVRNGRSSVFAGTENTPGLVDGENAKFNYPCGIACESDGVLYVADCKNRRIRKIVGRTVSTLHLFEDRPNVLRRPSGVNRLPDGTLLVLDQGRVLKIAKHSYITAIEPAETLNSSAHSTTFEPRKPMLRQKSCLEDVPDKTDIADFLYDASVKKKKLATSWGWDSGISSDRSGRYYYSQYRYACHSSH